MKIVVLAGGTSTERDISITTGTMVCTALREKEHEAVLVDVFLGIEDEKAQIDAVFKKQQDLQEEVAKLRKENDAVALLAEKREAAGDSFFGKGVLELCKESDMVFMALHGSNGEDGKIQAAFDLLGIRYTGSGYLGSALAMDKNLTKQLFVMNQVPTPLSVTLHKGAPREAMPYEHCVVKPCCGGSSVGVAIVSTEEDYQKALDDAFSYEDEVLVEQYIKGREFSIGLLEGKALPVIEIAPIEGFYDYKNKYEPGKTKDTCPAELSREQTEKLQKEAEHAYRVLGLDGYGRIDFLMDEAGEIYCLEANTLPGMTPTSLLPQEAAAVGIDFPTLCEQLIEVSKRRYQNRISK